MANENNKPNNASNTTTQKKKRSAAAQARRTAKWQAQKEAKKTAALAAHAEKKAEEERKVKSVLEMFPNVMGIIGAQGFMPNIKGVKGSSKEIRSALNSTPLFQNAERAAIYPGGITLLNHYLESRQWKKAMDLLNQGLPKRILDTPVRTLPPMPPLLYVCEWGQVALFQKLLEKGANPNIEISGGSGKSPLLTFITETFSPDTLNCVRLLIEHRADLNKRDSRDLSALDCAIRKRREDIAALLIEKGADLENANKRGYTAVITAISISDKRTLGLMVAKGIHINKETGPNQLSPLKTAVINGNAEILREVLALKPELDMKDNLGNTPLHYAVMVNALEKIALLKSAGANTRISNNEGVTAINIAQGLQDGGDNRAYKLLVD